MVLAHLISNGNSFAQTTISLGLLPEEIQEPSGLIMINGLLFTHNDSGAEALIYQLNQNTYEIDRTIFISNANNTDWEDLTIDNLYLYIGDFGNNSGDRVDLKILRIPIAQIMANDTVSAEFIEFAYEDQTNFESQPLATNFDCEAFISFGDSLVLFTKNWLDLKTTIYSINKNPGNYLARRIGNLDVSSLISGADFNYSNSELALSAYQLSGASIYRIQLESTISYWNNLVFVSESINLSSSFQVEGICYLNDSCLILSSESSFSGDAALYRNCRENATDIENHPDIQFFLFPNPSQDYIIVRLKNAKSNELFEITDESGRILISNITLNHSSSQIDISNLPTGVYFLKSSTQKYVPKQFLIKR
ncbi:MAG: T9SS type A sorting domain-containing protein [Bacteroidia bacterium]